MKNKIKVRLLVLYIYTFILIYFPNLSYYIKINGFILYGIFTIFYLSKISILNILFTIYYIIRTMIAGTDLLDFHNLRIIQNLMPVVILLGVIIIYNELENLGYNKKQKYKLIINTATIQGIIAIIMIFLPQFRNVAYNIFYQGNNEINIYISASRLYGICDGNYTYSLQVLSSFLAVFALYYAYFYKEKKCIINSIIILATTVLNGRTGIIIYIVSVILLILYTIFIKKKLLKGIQIIVICLIVIIIGMQLINIFVPSTSLIIQHAINDILNFKNQNNIEETETYMLIEGFIFPNKKIDFIFGCGYRLYDREGINFNDERVSDIGFINDIFMAGIFSIIFLYGGYINIIKSIIKNKTENGFERNISITLTLSVILSNIKGEVFRSQMQISTILILLIFMLMESKKYVKNNSNNTNV